MAGFHQTKRFTGIPGIPGAGTDIVANAPVKFVSGGSLWGVEPCINSTQGPILGVARASAAVGNAVDVWDAPDIHLAVCMIAGSLSGPSVVAGAYVGVASVMEVENSLKQKVNVPLISELTPASGTKIYAIGIAAENALAGNTFGYYLKPQQISGKGFAIGT